MKEKDDEKQVQANGATSFVVRIHSKKSRTGCKQTERTFNKHDRHLTNFF